MLDFEHLFRFLVQLLRVLTKLFIQQKQSVFSLERKKMHFGQYLYIHIIEALLMASKSYSLTKISIWSQIGWSIKLVGIMDKR